MSKNDFDQSELAGLLDDLCNGTLQGDRHHRLQAILGSSQYARLEYLDYIDLHVDLKRVHSQTGDLLRTIALPEAATTSLGANRNGVRFIVGFALAASVFIAAGSFWMIANARNERTAVAKNGSKVSSKLGTSATGELPSVLFAQAAAAKFFEEDLPLPGQPIQILHEYALSEGSIELKFPSGATAIIDAPAIFEVTSGSHMVLSMGNCSIYAPDGAQGFRVDTPRAEVVDLGTRFVVSVGQLGETAVKVVEGEADVYPKAEGNQDAKDSEAKIHLGKDQASFVGVQTSQADAELAAEGTTYRRTLPDRIIEYGARQNSDGAVDALESVTVQRGGQEFSYDIDQLVGIQLIHYRASSNAVMISGLETSDLSTVPRRDRRRLDLLDRDRNLCSGMINPGGSIVPLTKNPVVNSSESPHDDDTPGIAIRFDSPLVNSAGPDLVLFDLQTIVNPEMGDPFHVSPLDFRPGLHSLTIRKYDIDLLSLKAKYLAPFRLYRTVSVPQSLQEAMEIECSENSIHAVRSKALAIGIDLSDLGYEVGATVEGLFFQDALDDENYLDPIFIAGFPPVP